MIEPKILWQIHLSLYLWHFNSFPQPGKNQGWNESFNSSESNLKMLTRTPVTRLVDLARMREASMDP